MTTAILRIYDYFSAHRGPMYLIMAALTLIMVALVTRLDYEEDISDFLPLADKEVTALKTYQHVSGASRIVVTFQSDEDDTDLLTQAVDDYVLVLEDADTLGIVTDLLWQVDMSAAQDLAASVCEHAPYYLREADYQRIDSLLSQPDFIEEKIRDDRQALLLPTSGMLGATLGHDPLGLFTPLMGQLQASHSAASYETVDGYIFTPDLQRALVLLSSPYGSSETERNGQLVDMLRHAGASVMSQHPTVSVRLIGGPVIAVGNASRIKQDSILSVSIAVVVILAFLLWSFRSLHSLLLISLTVAWGWLFALAGLSLIEQHVSIIVIGISSVIIGIAVNYPLHVIAHSGHRTDRREALSEIVSPLVVGNITTVGAFLTLVPLQSTALRDLGLFASLLLVGTILFSVLFLPHLVRGRHREAPALLQRIASVRLENKRWFLIATMVITAVLGWFSQYTAFDPDMQHINYMTPEEKADVEYFAQFLPTDSTEANTTYALLEGSTMDEALALSERVAPEAALSRFVPSEGEQRGRLAMWDHFVADHPTLGADVVDAATREGFSPSAFAPFASMLHPAEGPLDAAALHEATAGLFAPLVHADTLGNRYRIVQPVREGETLPEGTFTFDVARLMRAVTAHLSDNFNYIGIACSLIVFLFLWASMRSLPLAIISFVPMAVSWLWILGLMAILGVPFNIVNIILATFIFGQGDDYTIFMTEGARHEHVCGTPVLTSYKTSILISAVIMFVGIGTLIISRHPALHSLAVVTMLGMLSVVLMAYTLPPYLYKLLIYARKNKANH